MAIAISRAEEIRDITHNLDLNIPEHRQIYDNLLFEFIAFNETRGGEPNLASYDDNKGKRTVGYGFNMDRVGAKQDWNKVFGEEVSFDKVRRGEVNISKEQARKLYDYDMAVRSRALESTYGSAWFKFKPNEQIMITDLHYNGHDKLVGKNTRFYGNMQEYAATSEDERLNNALIEVKDGSNPEGDKGLQNRRDVETAMGDSRKCPLRSKPNEEAVPRGKKLKAILGKTVVPRKHGEPRRGCTKSDRFYIWRTALDSRVRPTHVRNEGKIFDIKNPPKGGAPEEGYNCRCKADFFIPDSVEIEDTLDSKNIIQKYFRYPEDFPDIII